MFEITLPTLLRNEKQNIDFEKQTIFSQANKIHEEYKEVIQEIYGNQSYPRYKRTASELLDLIQAAKQELYILHLRNYIDIGEEINKHVEKLQSRGWEFEQPTPGTYIQTRIVTDVIFDTESQKYKFKYNNIDLEWSKGKFEQQFKPAGGD